MYRLLKRALDIIVSFIGLILLAPFLALLAAAVMLDSSGPPFYLARRVGRHGSEFRMLKFRTMRAHADQLGPGITTAGDTRITHVGGLLRRTKLDELPQLWNVLLGQMSLVGPRPEDPRYVAFYTPEQRRVLAERPGITGLAAVCFRHEEASLSGAGWEELYMRDIMPRKLALERAYLARLSLQTDALVMLVTLFPRALGYFWVRQRLGVTKEVCPN